MQGRNGADKLFYILVAAYIVLMFVNVFAKSMLIQLIGLLIFILAVYRYLSRNIVKRRRENDFVERQLGKIQSGYSSAVSRSTQNKTYCFKRCPNCGKTLRLPRVKGKHNTKCPACGCKFSVRIFMDKRK
jgi:Ca2+/Na+ antiporter